jgi:phosphatidate cytidylyltransferase
MKTNLFYRVITSVLFIPALVYIARFGKIPFLILIELGIGIGTHEFYIILEARGLKPYKGLGVIAALILGWNAYYASYIFTFLTITLLLLVLSAIELTRRNPDRAIYHISSTSFGVIYVGWLFSHLILLREIPDHIGGDYSTGISYALLPFVIAWTQDTFAYFIGTKFGKHKVLTRVSPGKSWEGLIGGGLFAILGLFIMRRLYSPYLSIYDCLILGILGTVAGPIGDLVESMIKRDARLKDTSVTIPGHGGVLDRFDSILFVAPIVYYYLRFFVV